MSTVKLEQILKRKKKSNGQFELFQRTQDLNSKVLKLKRPKENIDEIHGLRKYLSFLGKYLVPLFFHKLKA